MAIPCGPSEQNIDGNADSLYVGGPARYNTRNFDGIVGWFYFPVDDQPAEVTPITPAEPLTVDSNVFNPDDRSPIHHVEVSALNVRASAGLAGEIVAVYTAGMEINYDGWLDNDGYIWITYIGASGNRRYVAVGQSENGQRITDFGSFVLKQGGFNDIIKFYESKAIRRRGCRQTRR